MASILIEQKQISNGMTICFYDRSRPVVGDRWLVELTCEASIPISKELWEGKRDEDLSLLARIREIIGENLIFSITKTRNFIPLSEREITMAELIQQIDENIMIYLNDPKFPQKLFAKHYEETKEKCLLEDHMRQTIDQNENEDDDIKDLSAHFSKQDVSR